MDGYDVITMDDQKAGHVVGREGTFVVVEHGTLRKHRRPLPDAFVTIDDEEQVVRATVPKDVIETAPELSDDGFDERAAAAHYGLADGYEDPETEGYGRLAPDETAVPAEVAAQRAGMTPASEARAGARDQLAPGEGPNDVGPPSPGITGGDRRRDFPRDDAAS